MFLIKPILECSILPHQNVVANAIGLREGKSGRIETIKNKLRIIVVRVQHDINNH